MAGAASLLDKIPILRINDDVVITKRGDWAVGFKLDLREIFSLSQDDFEALNIFFNNVIDRMPEFSVMHKQDWFTKKKFKPNNKRGDSILGKHSDFKFIEREHVNHECYIFFIKTTKNVKTRSYSTNLFNSTIVPADSINERAFNNFYSDIASIEGMFKANTEYFSRVERLTSKDYYDSETDMGLLSRYFTLSRTREMVDIDFRNGMMVGNKHCCFHSIDSLKQFPENIDLVKNNNEGGKANIKALFSFAHPVALALKFNHIYNQYVFKDNFKETIREKELQKNKLSNFSAVSSTNDINYKRMKEFLDASQLGSIPVRFHANVLTYSDSPAELADDAIMVGNGFMEMGIKPRLNKFDSKELYWAGVPGNGSDIPANLTSTLFADQAACFINMETAYRDSNSDFGIRFCERLNGYPLHVDILFEPLKAGVISNRNMIIVGPSGSGKSFLTNTYLSHLFDHGHHMVLVDMGRSYKRLCELNNGIFIDFNESNPPKFNPFFLDDKIGLTDDKIENIKALLFTIWLDEEASKLQDNVMREHIVNYYKIASKNPSLRLGFNSFYEFIKAVYLKKKKDEPNSTEFNHFDYEHFIITTRIYYKEGKYDQLLNSSTKLDYTNNQLVVFEMESIKDNPTLLSIYTIMIIDTYLNKLFRLPGENIMKALLMEEAWKALMNDKMSSFLLYAVKTVRKYYGQLITVTQELDDLIGNKFVKKALVGNSDIKILLDQSKYKSGFVHVKELIGLTDHEASLVQSLNKQPQNGRKYMEFYIKLGTISKVYAVEVSDMEYAAFTTNKDETDVIYRLQNEKGGDLIQALEQFTENKIKK
ncbi:TraG family conjugative transposon ATPase [Pedobacter jeongneungensis]|uniref:TraG family conjugative transposon ATPase n=1 Tax=Pedobacter jeongneungensis TaxID=947309 RepID=UPI00046A719D|nr:TraG family conjugative transposon ATPase [Pedobacter jeongneungensis]